MRCADLLIASRKQATDARIGFTHTAAEKDFDKKRHGRSTQMPGHQAETSESGAGIRIAATRFASEKADQQPICRVD